MPTEPTPLSDIVTENTQKIVYPEITKIKQGGA